MLTKRQKPALLCIKNCIDEHAASPSRDKLQMETGLKSRSSIFQPVNAFEERKFIKRRRHKARAIESLQPPSGHARPPQSTRCPATLSSVADDMQRVQPGRMGMLATDAPIETILNVKGPRPVAA